MKLKLYGSGREIFMWGVLGIVLCLSILYVHVQIVMFLVKAYFAVAWIFLMRSSN
jgi:hypothetical protein